LVAAGSRVKRALALPRPTWPWDQVQLAAGELAALKAISADGMAALTKICSGGGSGGNPFTPGGPEGARATDFGCGKLWVLNTVRQARATKAPVDPRGPPPELPDDRVTPPAAAEAKE
jgi:hypothetical protein